jgi:hypothetical protein
MHRSLKGLSFIGGTLLFGTFLLGIFLRFYDLSLQSPWTDELASWFYLRHLDQVFAHESHSPVYYFLLRFFLGPDASVSGLRYFSASLSVINLGVLYFLGSRFMERNKLILFMILLSLCPADIVYARMARHYFLLLEGPLILLFMIKGNVRTWIIWVYSFILSSIHIFALIPIITILIFDFLKNRKLRRTLIIFSSTLGIVIYYSLRLFFLGYSELGKNVSWNLSRFDAFISSIATQFLGGAFPRLVYYPVSLELAWTITTIAIVFVIIKRKDSGILFFGTLILSILFIEIINLGWINLRLNRYIIFLAGFLTYAVADAFERPSIKQLVGILALSLGLIIPLKLTHYFPWDDEVVREWKDYSAEHPGMNKLICVNKAQSLYYGFKGYLNCREAVSGLDLTKPLLFFDLNNNDRDIAVYLSQKMEPVTFKTSSHSNIIHFEPR